MNLNLRFAILIVGLTSLLTPFAPAALGAAATRAALPANADATQRLAAGSIGRAGGALLTAGRSVGQAAAASTTQKALSRSRSTLVAQVRARHRGLRDRPLASGEKISLSTRKADLVEVLRAFAILADVNLVVDPAVQGEVTVELHEVAWEDALAVILRTHRLAAELDGRIWLIRKP